MYEELPHKQTVGGLVAQRKPDITLGENLDEQIKYAEARLNELIETKKRIESTGLLTARIDDLHRALQF